MLGPQRTSLATPTPCAPDWGVGLNVRQRAAAAIIIAAVALTSLCGAARPGGIETEREPADSHVVASAATYSAFVPGVAADHVPEVVAPGGPVAPLPELPEVSAAAVEPTAVVRELRTTEPSGNPGQLGEPQLREVLTLAGWPESLHDEAVAVVRCESNFRPGAVGDGGASVGLFQLNKATWFPYAGEDAEMWADPVTNARVAWATYNYDLARGYVPWKQWTCRP